jgi:hypothetical protein
MIDERAALQNAIGGLRVTHLIAVAAKLRLADHLAAGPKTVGQLAHATGCDAGSLYRVLRALASLGIFAEESDRSFGLTSRAEYLRSDIAGSLRVAAEVAGEEWVWRPWGTLLHSVTSGTTAFDHLYGRSTWEWFGENPAAAALFNQHMEDITSADADAVVAACDLSGVHTLIDIGGGQGRLIAAILRRNSAMRGVLFNLPHVIDSADRQKVQDVAPRLEFVAGDFFKAVPTGGDLYILKEILHDWDDARAREILANCHQAMHANATLLIIEHVICPANQPCSAKLVDIQMMVRTGGRNRTQDEFRELLVASGFTEPEVFQPSRGPGLLKARQVERQSNRHDPAISKT